jgi:hypothetical protein
MTCLRVAREDVAHEVDQLLEARRLPRRLEQKQLPTQAQGTERKGERQEEGQYTGMHRLIVDHICQ